MLAIASIYGAPSCLFQRSFPRIQPCLVFWLCFLSHHSLHFVRLLYKFRLTERILQEPRKNKWVCVNMPGKPHSIPWLMIICPIKLPFYGVSAIFKQTHVCSSRSIAIAPEVEVPPANEDLLPRADHLLLAAKDLLSRSREAQRTGDQCCPVGFNEI